MLRTAPAASSRRTAALAAALRSPGLTTGPSMMASAAATGALTEAELVGVRGYFGGSGSDGMNTDLARDTILRLAGKETPSVLYIGTPTYDLSGPFEAQTGRFAEVGCPVSQLRLVEDPPEAEEMAALVRGADVIVVSGGNPLYAVARWQALGVDALLREAMASGTVMCGGSCGLISWFDAGHSDSADPASYKEPMLRGAATYAPPPAPLCDTLSPLSVTKRHRQPCTRAASVCACHPACVALRGGRAETAGGSAPPDVAGATSWEYIRCPVRPPPPLPIFLAL